MNAATRWWLNHTPQGRRVLERALPPSGRRMMCREHGHERLGDGSCRRCGDRPEPEKGRRR